MSGVSSIRDSIPIQAIDWAPRVVCALAAAVAVLSLIVLGCKYLDVQGTTSFVTAQFRATCLTVAQWSGIVCGGAIVIGLVKDLIFAAAKRSTAQELKWEVIITLLSPIVCVVSPLK